jgi:diadenosine tetraphosphate (Ap4A) HIT family hydrolase
MPAPRPFCYQEDVVLQNQLAWAKYDIYPVSPGHLLIMPCRHVESFFDTTIEERQALNELLAMGKALLDREFQPDGYNIGINCGVAAGQTVMHLHIHLIPRYQGDLDNPRGGVRGVIPDKRVYEKP